MGVAMSDRYVTANCLAGACSACLFNAAGCAHPCHIDAAARAVDIVPEPMVHTANPAFEQLVVERATALCLDAPANSHSMAPAAPCTVHASEARRVLFDQYLRQQSAVA